MNLNVIPTFGTLGVQRLADKGSSSLFVAAATTFFMVHQALNGLFSHGRNAGKIAVSLGASWQYMPFHFSEKAMIARTEDMLALWSLPEDPRPADWPPTSCPIGWNCRRSGITRSCLSTPSNLRSGEIMPGVWAFLWSPWPTLTVLHRRASWPLSRI